MSLTEKEKLIEALRDDIERIRSYDCSREEQLVDQGWADNMERAIVALSAPSAPSFGSLTKEQREAWGPAPLGDWNNKKLSEQQAPSTPTPS